MHHKTTAVVLWTIGTIWILATEFVAGFEEDRDPVEKRLLDKLFKNYDKHKRPVNPKSNLTTVDFFFLPIFFTDLNEARRYVELYGVVIMRWNDDRLKWNKTEYSGQSTISVGAEDIWTPEVYLYSSHSGNIDIFPKMSALCFYDGTMIWFPVAHFGNRFIMDLRNYPNDEQTVNFVFGLWSHDGEEIDLSVYGGWYGLSFINNTNVYWEATKLRGRNVVKQKWRKEPYRLAVFSVILKRRFPAPLQVTWGPSMACLLLSLTMFWFPADSEKKILPGGFSILLMAVLMVYVAKATTTAVTAWMAVSPLHYTFYAIISAILLEIITLHLARTSGPTRPPRRLIEFLQGVGGRFLGLCFVRPPTKVGDLAQLQEEDEETLTPEDEIPPREEWKMLATAVDRLLFVAYLLILLVTHIGS